MSPREQVATSSRVFCLVAVLVATAIHADTTLNAKVQTSHDGTTWFDLVSFTAITDTSGAEIKPILVATLPALAHVRAVVALTGSTLAATVSISMHMRDAR